MLLSNAKGSATRSLSVLAALAGLLASPAAQAAETNRAPDFAGEAASPDAQYTARWVVETDDNLGQPFAIVDKKNAKLFLFERSGRLIGATTVLLGAAPGDESMPGIGKLVPSQIPFGARTTPAGRFPSEPGHNSHGESIVWFDYDAALAIHRLRPAAAQERRPERMASATPDDNRISLGCVVVPGSFYDAVLSPVLGKQRGVVYVMPESQPVQAMFNSRGIKLAMLSVKP